MKTRFTLIFALLLLCFGTGAALAQTADGQTPAEETVCDNESGAAYGLCNAYCEAMDCDSNNPHASATACTKVRTKFQNITGHDMPCEAPVVCPCLSIPRFSEFMDQNETEECGHFATPVGTGLHLYSLGRVFTLYAGVPSDPVTACGLHHGFTGSGASLTITGQEAAACEQLFRDEAASLGVTCF